MPEFRYVCAWLSGLIRVNAGKLFHSESVVVIA